MNNRTFAILLLSCGLLLLASCSHTYKPAFVLSLHDFSDPQMGVNLSSTVRNSSRELQYTINRTPFLDARDLMEAEVYGPNEDGLYGLRVLVNHWKLYDMHHLAGSNLGLVYAVVVDGVYVGTSHYTTEMRDQDILVIEPLWNLYDATMIAENMKDNQDHLNTWHSIPFRR